jgi:hypothetical protein
MPPYDTANDGEAPAPVTDPGGIKSFHRGFATRMPRDIHRIKGLQASPVRRCTDDPHKVQQERRPGARLSGQRNVLTQERACRLGVHPIRDFSRSAPSVACDRDRGDDIGVPQEMRSTRIAVARSAAADRGKTRTLEMDRLAAIFASIQRRRSCQNSPGSESALECGLALPSEMGPTRRDLSASYKPFASKPSEFDGGYEPEVRSGD